MATLQIYTNRELKAAVEQVAKEEDRSVSYLVRQWIEAALKARTQQESSAKHPQK